MVCLSLPTYEQMTREKRGAIEDFQGNKSEIFSHLFFSFITPLHHGMFTLLPIYHLFIIIFNRMELLCYLSPIARSA